MRHLQLAIVFGLLSALCFGMGSKQPTKPKKPVVVEETLPPVVVTPDISKPMLVIEKCTNCTEKEWEFIKRAAVKMNQVVQTQCFSDALSAMPLIQTNGLTPSEVVKSLVHADIVIDVEMYYTSKRVLGYTVASQMKEWINRRYMLEWNECDLGSLLAHETSHKVGYGHDFNPTKRRPNSVPYSVNKAFKSCCVK